MLSPPTLAANRTAPAGAQCLGRAHPTRPTRGLSSPHPPEAALRNPPGINRLGGHHLGRGRRSSPLAMTVFAMPPVRCRKDSTIHIVPDRNNGLLLGSARPPSS